MLHFLSPTRNKTTNLYIGFSLLIFLFICHACGNKDDDTEPPVIIDPKDQVSEMPYEKLSDYNLFTGDLKNLEPAEGVLPYELNTPLFSNYALKSRFIWMPSGKSATYNEEDIFDFPVGTIIVKTFYYDNDFQDPSQGKRIIETRLLIRQETEWIAIPYLWNDEQTEADKHIVGRQTTVNWKHFDGSERSANYVVPNQNDCLGCHNVNNTIQPIGPKARNINSTLAYEDGSMNQLEKWSATGYLSGVLSPENAPAVPIMNDANNGTLEERARAYLDVNCGHCHNPQGPANNSGLNLYYNETNPVALGICKIPVAAGGGSGGLSYGIVPGKPDSSIMVYRMESIEIDVAMPELSRSVIHTEGVQLIKDWISTLEGSCN